MSSLKLEYLDNLYTIKANGIINIPFKNSDCSNIVYYCNTRDKNIAEMLNETNNYESTEKCRIILRNNIYILKYDENIFQCIVKSLNDKDNIMYFASRMIERRIDSKTVRKVIKHPNFKYNIDLSNLDFSFDKMSSILKVYGIVYSKPEKLCREDTSIKTISCKVSTYSYSANDYGSSNPLSSFNCSGTTISATAEFEYPNYFACAVSDDDDNILSFEQIKTKYYNKNTDNHNSNHNNTVSGIYDAVYGIAVLIVIIICCCISCCCYKFCKRKNKVSSEIEMNSQSIIQQQNQPQIVNAIPIQPYPYNNNNNIPVQGIPYNPQPYYPNTYDQQQQQPPYYIQPPQNGVVNDPNNPNVVNMNYYQQQQPQENVVQPIYYSQPIYQPIV